MDKERSLDSDGGVLILLVISDHIRLGFPLQKIGSVESLFYANVWSWNDSVLETDQNGSLTSDWCKVWWGG